jgi:hypothetical protein
MTGNRNIPRRIGKHHLRPLISEKPDVALAHQGITAQDAMLAEQPEISRLRHRRRGLVGRRQIVLLLAVGTFEGEVDLTHLEAGDPKVGLAADLKNVGELELERL